MELSLSSYFNNCCGYFRIYFKVTATEWMALTGVIGLVLVSETMNTAIEYLVNLVSPEWNELAGKLKI